MRVLLDESLPRRLKLELSEPEDLSANIVRPDVAEHVVPSLEPR